MSEIVWESDAQSYGFTVMSNGMVWPDDRPGTLVEAQFTSARGDGADLDRDPDMVPSGPGRVTFTPLVRTVGYDGEHGKRIVSLHPFEAVVGDDGYLYTPDEYGQPGIRGIVLPSNNSDVVDEHDWTWRVTFDIPNTTIRPTHIPTPHDHSVDIKDYLDSDANHGVRVVVDRVAARETLAARDEVIQARDLVLPARDQTLAARDATLALGLTVDTSVGTRVFVGNTMIHGDTGWRDISSLVTFPVTNGWIRMRRVGLSVEVLANSLSVDTSGSVSILTLPPGFRPAALIPLETRAYWGSDTVEIGRVNSTGVMQFRTLSSGNQMNIHLTFTTQNPWPTSLPGSPA